MKEAKEKLVFEVLFQMMITQTYLREKTLSLLLSTTPWANGTSLSTRKWTGDTKWEMPSRTPHLTRGSDCYRRSGR